MAFLFSSSSFCRVDAGLIFSLNHQKCFLNGLKYFICLNKCLGCKFFYFIFASKYRGSTEMWIEFQVFHRTKNLMTVAPEDV